MKRTETPTYPKTVGPWELEPHYSRHVGAMTSEGLHDKQDIAFQLALRDFRLAALSRIVRRALASHQLEKLEDARPYLDDAACHPTVPSPLLELLARIHGDGGHRVANVGLDQACAEAHQIIAELRAR